MATPENSGPGWPGIPARWTSSAKSGVGAALGQASRVWFTLSHGIFNEIYYPRVDQACLRDMGLIVTDDDGFLSEEKRDAESQVRWLAPGVPAFRLTNTCRDGRYRIEKTVLCDPCRDVVLQHTRFTALKGDAARYHLHVLLSPHLDNHGANNTAWVGDTKGTPMLFAERGANALALACCAPWRKRSAGYVGTSDGWQDLRRHGRMNWEYPRAENGNVALTAEIDLTTAKGEFVLALGFGRNAAEAGQRALASLQDGFTSAQAAYVQQWRTWLDTLLPLADAAPASAIDLYRISATVVRVHEAPNFPGGMIASLSIPWGFHKGDDDLGGYHLVWPRDLVESAGGLLAAGAHADARRVLTYLQATQEADGHWAQNMWLDGSPYWNGIQMDETALPILLVDLARREQALCDDDMARFWPMVRRAAAYLVCTGPVSGQDRWEEDPGYSPFTVAAEIAALLAAADLAEQRGEAQVAGYLRETADVWYDAIDRWMYVTGTDWCREYGVDGYYVRIAPVDGDDGVTRLQSSVPVRNVEPSRDSSPANHLVSPDALALVRFGLRAPDDPRIRDTITVIDALLKLDTATGPVWHRYNGDGYGEHADGEPFDGTGVGRAWPLLTGERAHYELVAGHLDEARRLQQAMASFAGAEGLLPEQIWDSDDIPERELFRGRPSGSAMPLVWAHAEYLKLLRSLRDGRVFDLPPQTADRYQGTPLHVPFAVWRFNQKVRELPASKTLRVETLAPATVRWSADGWNTKHELPTRDTGLAIHVADLDTTGLAVGSQVTFTLHWTEADRWEGVNFTVDVVAGAPVLAPETRLG